MSIAILSYMKSDTAQLDLKHLVEQLNSRVEKQEQVINAQSDVLEQLNRKFLKQEARDEGLRLGALQEQHRQLQKLMQPRRQQTQTKPAPARMPASLPAAMPHKSLPRIKSKPFTQQQALGF